VTFVVDIHFAGLTGSAKFELSATSFVHFIANIGLFFFHYYALKHQQMEPLAWVRF
jgi:hypothetical protein